LYFIPKFIPTEIFRAKMTKDTTVELKSDCDFLVPYWIVINYKDYTFIV